MTLPLCSRSILIHYSLSFNHWIQYELLTEPLNEPQISILCAIKQKTNCKKLAVIAYSSSLLLVTTPLILNSSHQLFSVHSHDLTDDVVPGNFSLTSLRVQSSLNSANEFSCRRYEDTSAQHMPCLSCWKEIGRNIP